jgi:hypothetical protein
MLLQVIQWPILTLLRGVRWGLQILMLGLGIFVVLLMHATTWLTQDDDSNG